MKVVRTDKADDFCDDCFTNMIESFPNVSPMKFELTIYQMRQVFESYHQLKKLSTHTNYLIEETVISSVNDNDDSYEVSIEALEELEELKLFDGTDHHEDEETFLTLDVLWNWPEMPKHGALKREQNEMHVDCSFVD